MDLFVYLAEDSTKLAFGLETKGGLSCWILGTAFCALLLGTNCASRGWDFGNSEWLHFNFQ